MSATKTMKIGLSNADKTTMKNQVYASAIATLITPYSSASTYAVGDFCSKDGNVYKCTTAISTAEAWNSAHWASATLNDIVDAVNNAVQFVNDKANVDGNYPTMTVGMADNLTPYDESAGDDQDEPFSFQATGTGNGTQPDFSAGSIALMKEKQGNTVVVNQLGRHVSGSESYITWNGHIGTLHIDNSEGSSTAYASIININIITGHKYLFLPTTSNNGNCYVYLTASNQAQLVNGGITEATLTGDYPINISVNAGEVAEMVFYDYVIDLTQWFNGDIPQDLLDNPSNFFRYYQGSLAYNEGALVNANGRYIKCIGMNQWDEEWRNGVYNSSGAFTSNDSNVCTKNPTKVVGNSQYYIKVPTNIRGFICYYDANGNFIDRLYFNGSSVFTTPSNCYYINFHVSDTYGATYNNDISINLYYEDEARCLTYEPYEVLTNNDTGTEVLRSAGNVKDSKAPDGTITRRIGVVDLGSLDWAKDNTQEGMFATSGIQTTVKKYRGANLLSKIYINSGVSSFANMPDMTAQIFDSGVVYCKNLNAYSTMNAEQFKTAVSGVYLFYELAEPTTEQGTPYSENLVIDDFGSMDFQGTSGVPQGALIFYPVDYKAFVDTLYNYTEGTPSNLALKSDVASEQSARESVDTQLLNAVGGTLRQLLANAKSIDFLNTDFIDLGELTWEYTIGQFFCRDNTLINAIKHTSYLKNMICSKYKTFQGNAILDLGNLEVTLVVEFVGEGIWSLNIKDDTYSDATAFKNAMKGVLLAYEKASE